MLSILTEEFYEQFLEISQQKEPFYHAVETSIRRKILFLERIPTKTID